MVNIRSSEPLRAYLRLASFFLTSGLDAAGENVVSDEKSSHSHGGGPSIITDPDSAVGLGDVRVPWRGI